jgi:hypothetical protein
MSSISQSAPWLVKGIFIIVVLIDPVLSITWQDEVNVSICNWPQLRGKSFREPESRETYLTRSVANIIRDTIYLDGGSIWWQM